MHLAYIYANTRFQYINLDSLLIVYQSNNNIYSI